MENESLPLYIIKTSPGRGTGDIYMAIKKDEISSQAYLSVSVKSAQHPPGKSCFTYPSLFKVYTGPITQELTNKTVEAFTEILRKGGAL